MCILTSFCANRKWNYCISISWVPFSHFWEVVGEAVEMMMMWRQARNLLERDLSLFSVTNIHPCQKWRFILTLKKSFEFQNNGDYIMILNILWCLSDPQIWIGMFKKVFNVIFVISSFILKKFLSFSIEMIKTLQLNKQETDPYFLQILQSNTSICLTISVFCKSCESICESEITPVLYHLENL